MVKLLKKITLQLFTLQSIVESNFDLALKTTCDIGYTGVEFTPPEHIMSLDDIVATLSKYPLEVNGLHIIPDTFAADPDKYIAAAKRLGCKNIVCPWAPVNSLENAASTAALINSFINKIYDNGLTYSYHNHNHEFAKCGDKFLYDELFERLDPRVGCELDVFWVTYAGCDPLDILRKYKDRLHMVHLKDMLDKESKSMTEVGHGIIDMPAVIKYAQSLGIEIFIVEQDNTYGHPAQSARDSYTYLSGLEK